MAEASANPACIKSGQNSILSSVPFRLLGTDTRSTTKFTLSPLIYTATSVQGALNSERRRTISEAGKILEREKCAASIELFVRRSALLLGN
ncbi:hypothetical protein Mapa_002004 [Marchantia paleacea]|nr:hypothetical protein Mapa_002004 [Marchantia paleacea]